MASDNRLSRHVHGFFHEYLTSQRNVSPHTVFSYRDTLKLFLSYASQQLSTPVVDLNLDALTPDLVLRFLNHLETDRSNTAATRNVRLAALHVFFRYVGAHDPLSFDNCQRIVSIPKKRTTTPATDYPKREGTSVAHKRVHPHSLRHTLAMHMLQAGADPNAIRDVLGHASSETTWRYARINIEMKRKAIESHKPDAPKETPVWRKDQDLLDYLESLGKARDYVKPI